MIKRQIISYGLVSVAIAIFWAIYPVRAATPADGATQDARCILVAARLATDSSQDVRSRAGMMLMYYLGRFDGRALPYDLQNLLSRELRNMTTDEFQKNAQLCNVEFTSKGREISLIGKNLSARSK